MKAHGQGLAAILGVSRCSAAPRAESLGLEINRLAESRLKRVAAELLEAMHREPRLGGGELADPKAFHGTELQYRNVARRASRMPARNIRSADVCLSSKIIGHRRRYEYEIRANMFVTIQYGDECRDL
jgi:hypothetical protein